MTTKIFIYHVGEFQFTDSEAFGQAWQEAKAKAAELHAPIYRSVIETKTREEVYVGGLFLSTERGADRAYIF